MDDSLREIIDLLEELQVDNTVPRNAKAKLSEMQKVLEDESVELSLRVNRVLSDLEELSNDINIPMFIRTQLWNLTSMLESLNA